MGTVARRPVPCASFWRHGTGFRHRTAMPHLLFYSRLHLIDATNYKVTSITPYQLSLVSCRPLRHSRSHTSPRRVLQAWPLPDFCQGLKTLFCVHEDELFWAADELLREEGQTHPVVLSHNDLNVTTVASSGGSIGEGAVGRCPPPEWELSLKSFFGNQFSQFVLIFLSQGLRNSSPITNLSPQDC